MARVTIEVDKIAVSISNRAISYRLLYLLGNLRLLSYSSLRHTRLYWLLL